MRHLSNPQDRERLLRAILEHSEMGVWHADAKGRTLYVNPAGCRWMGVKRDAALLGRSYQEFVAPESWTGMRKEWAKRRQGIASSYELEMIRPDGRRINLLACGVPVPGSLPGAYTVVGLLLNVTAMKRTETELRRSEELLQRIVENVPAGVVYAASDGRIQRANSVAQEFLGLSYRKLKACFAADWNGTTLREDGSPFPAAEYPVTRCLKTGRAQGPATIGIRRPDGKVRWGIFSASPAQEPGPGGRRGAVVTFVDITERRSREDVLRLHAQILDHLGEGVSVLDARGRYQLVNRAYERMFGFRPGELLGQDPRVVRDLPAKEAWRSIRELMSETAKRGQWAGVLPCRRKDGSRILSEASITPFRRAGQTYFVGVHSDITERSRLARELAEREELYRTLFEAAPLGLGISDARGNLLAYNDAMLRYGGYERKDIEKIRNVQALYYDPADRKKILKEVRARGRVDRYEVRYRNKAGAPYWTLTSLRPVRYRGQFCMQAMVEDITERKAAEEELQRESRSLKLVNTVALAANQARAPQDVLRTVLREVCSFAGWQAGHAYEVLGGAKRELAALDLWYAAQGQGFAELRKAAAGLRLREGEGLPGRVLKRGAALSSTRLAREPLLRRISRARRPEARMACAFPVWAGRETVAVLEFFSTGTRAPDARLTELFTTVMAQAGRVFERSRAEEQLRREKEFSAHVIQASFDGVVAVDRELRYTLWNSGMERISGVPARATLGRKAVELFPFLKRTGEIESIRQTLKGQEISTTDRPYHVAQTGRKGFYEARYTALRDESGKIVGGLGVIREITERKRAEDSLRDLSARLLETQEAERRRVARELHDGVNQILSAAQMQVGALNHAGSGEGAAKLRTLLDQAIGELRRISHNLRPAVLDDLGLPAAVRSACDEFREQSGIGLNLRLEGLPARLPAQVELTVFRILQEALSNAWRHAEARRVEVRLSANRRLLRLAVRDDGKGWHPGPGDGAARHSRGLGLDNMRERAQFAGGRFEIRTAPGRGTEIRVRIPLAPPQEDSN